MLNMPESVRDKMERVGIYLKKVGISPLGALLIVIIVVAPLFLQNEFWTRLLISSLMFGALAMGFDFTTGYINIINFGYAAFWGLGAYTSAILAVKMGISPWMGMFAGAITAGILGFAVGILTLRLAGIFASCMAWFVALALMSVTANWIDLTRGNSGLCSPPLIDTTMNLPYFYVILVMTLAIYIMFILITKSHIGLAFKAIGQDPQAAQASGINITKYKVFNMTLSCAVAGLVGGFYAHYIGILTPNVMHTSHTVEYIAISYIGGRGTLWGSLLSALIIIPIMEYLKDLMELRLILYGVLLILVMLYYPTGLAGICKTVYGYFQRKGFFKGRVGKSNVLTVDNRG